LLVNLEPLAGSQELLVRRKPRWL